MRAVPPMLFGLLAIQLALLGVRAQRYRKSPDHMSMMVLLVHWSFVCVTGIALAMWATHRGRKMVFVREIREPLSGAYIGWDIVCEFLDPDSPAKPASAKAGKPWGELVFHTTDGARKPIQIRWPPVSGLPGKTDDPGSDVAAMIDVNEVRELFGKLASAQPADSLKEEMHALFGMVRELGEHERVRGHDTDYNALFGRMSPRRYEMVSKPVPLVKWGIVTVVGFAIWLGPVLVVRFRERGALLNTENPE